MISDLNAILAFGLLSALLLFLGWRRGFFKLPIKVWSPEVLLKHLIGAFLIYFTITFLITGITVYLFKDEIYKNYLGYSSWFNFIFACLIFICLALYLKWLPRDLCRAILRRPCETHPLLEDVYSAFYAWIIAFPLVLFLSQALELILTEVFKLNLLPDQIAVKFLKSTFEKPLYFTITTLSIIVLAPLIEETLFRGFFQSFIRKHLGSKQAIFITSVCFAFFHYSASQGIGNISIIGSLFVLSLFLGFLYEKQGSLLAPITLHALFNSVSVFNLYLFGGFTTL